MRTVNNQSSVLSCSFTWWSFLITGEVFQYKDLLVSSSIFGEKIIVVKWSSFNVKTSLNMKCLFCEKRFMSFLWLHFLWCEVFVLPLVQIFSHIWNMAFGSSSWKLLELKSVSGFLAYITRSHDWRIEGLAEK